jgi:hypothetical protein
MFSSGMVEKIISHVQVSISVCQALFLSRGVNDESHSGSALLKRASSLSFTIHVSSNKKPRTRQGFMKING